MKTIGLLGGMSWESTQTYYRRINEGVRDALGGLHSAKLVLYSVDFAEIEALQHQGDWNKMAEILVAAAQSLELAGADFLLVCTNTMHKVAPQIEAQINIPLLHIADATALALKKDGIKTVGLLGTKFTMEQDFYSERLRNAGLEVLVPEADAREIVHRVIYDELCRGEINARSKQAYLDIVSDLSRQGAEAVILGCTEIGLLIGPDDSALPVYDTTEIHAGSAVSLSLQGDH